MDFDDYETLPTNNVAAHMIAGAIAGVMEHCVMYPMDSVKTRMQNLAPTAVDRGMGETLMQMVRKEGLLRPVRGMSAVVVGAGPAHALYFSCYEHVRDILTKNSFINKHVSYGAAGCVATLLHDAVMNPAEVVKQRLQMINSPFKTSLQCLANIYKSEGLTAFYRSYTTQLTMNVPFQAIHFTSYEFLQNLTNPTRGYNPGAHMVSGALAGALAAAITTPLDVCKTVLNTQSARATGLIEAVRAVYMMAGPAGYFRGIQARVIYQMPSTAICWSLYELFKYILINHEDFASTLSLKVVGIASMEAQTKEASSTTTSIINSSCSSSSSSSSNSSVRSPPPPPLAILDISHS